MSLRPNRLPIAHLLAASCVLLGASLARADDAASFPQRTVRIVAAQQPGSATDQIARLMADFLGRHWNRTVIVENRAGASGAIGTLAAARAEPDGHTLLVGGLSSLVMLPELTPDAGFDPETEFAAIGRIAYVPFVLAVSAQIPATTVGELAAYARARPGAVSFATAGITAFSAYCLRTIAAATGVEFLAVEYKGSSTATLDLIAGRVDARVSELDAILQHAQSGKVRILAVAGNRRSSHIPDVPTLAEAGVPGIDVTPWYGLLAPAGISPAIRERLMEAYSAAMQNSDVRARLQFLGNEPIRDEPGMFARALRSDRMSVRTVMRAGAAVPAQRP